MHWSLVIEAPPFNEANHSTKLIHQNRSQAEGHPAFLTRRLLSVIGFPYSLLSQVLDHPECDCIA